VSVSKASSAADDQAMQAFGSGYNPTSPIGRLTELFSMTIPAQQAGI
jgi:hypothetical protein